MSLITTPHLNLDGRATEALELYRSVFGGEIRTLTYGAMGVSDDPALADRLVWGQVESPAGFRIMAFDVYPGMPYDAGTSAFYVSVRGTDVDEIRAAWAGLAEGAVIRQELAASAWAPIHGMLTDRFGVTWVLDVAAAHAAG
jgi:PhnB protein